MLLLTEDETINKNYNYINICKNYTTKKQIII